MKNMIKMFFAEGQIGANSDNRGLGFNRLFMSNLGRDFSLTEAFKKSCSAIRGMTGRFDVMRYKDKATVKKDTFILYDTKMDKQEIIKAVDTLILRSDHPTPAEFDAMGGVTGYPEDAMAIKDAVQGTDINKAMGLPGGAQYIQETIWWDVDNNIVIIIGRSELKRFARALLEEINNITLVFGKEKNIENVENPFVRPVIEKMLLLANKPELHKGSDRYSLEEHQELRRQYKLRTPPLHWSDKPQIANPTLKKLYTLKIKRKQPKEQQTTP